MSEAKVTLRYERRVDSAFSLARTGPSMRKPTPRCARYLAFHSLFAIGIQYAQFEQQSLNLEIGPSVIRQALVMEQSLDGGVAGDEVGEADAGVIGGDLEGGEEGWYVCGVHGCACCFMLGFRFEISA